ILCPGINYAIRVTISNAKSNFNFISIIIFHTNISNFNYKPSLLFIFYFNFWVNGKYIFDESLLIFGRNNQTVKFIINNFQTIKRVCWCTDNSVCFFNFSNRFYINAFMIENLGSNYKLFIFNGISQ